MKADRRLQIVKILFWLYFMTLLWLLLFRRIGSDRGEAGMNLQPLDTVRRYFWVLRYSQQAVQRQMAGANLVGNVSLFFPLGIFLPVLFPKMHQFWHFFLCVGLSIMALEVAQMLTGLGVCDVDDWLLNSIGSMIGWLVWKCCMSGKRTE